MKTSRFYLFMILIALLLGGVAYSVTPNHVQATGDCDNSYVCKITYTCGDVCPTNPLQWERIKNYYYYHTNPCEWGCSKVDGCTSLCL